MRFNSLIPELAVSDIEKSTRFYVGMLGFRVEYERKESGFLFLSYEGAQLMIERSNHRWDTGPLRHPYGRGINLQISARSISRIANRLRKSRYPVKVPAHDNWYRKGESLLGCRELLVEDPDGYLLRFSQDIGRRSAGGR
jgi:lactoylglutathione lyase